jgi:hypothetical protein
MTAVEVVRVKPIEEATESEPITNVLTKAGRRLAKTVP